MTGDVFIHDALNTASNAIPLTGGFVIHSLRQSPIFRTPCRQNECERKTNSPLPARRSVQPGARTENMHGDDRVGLRLHREYQ